MKHIKRVIIIFLIFIVMAAPLVPSLRCSHFVYADSTTDSWTSVTTNQDLAEAFRYYCKSRNLVVDGSVADALTSFTTNSFNSICNSLGIDITALQAHLKRSTDSNGNIQFLFDQFGVTAYNRIFAEFLQNNDIAVGDNVEDKEVFNGYSYQGNLIYIVQQMGVNNVSLSNILVDGTTFNNMDGNFFKNYSETTVFSIDPFNNGTKSLTLEVVDNGLTWRLRGGTSSRGIVYRKNSSNQVTSYGVCCLMQVRSTNALSFGVITYNYNASTGAVIDCNIRNLYDNGTTEVTPTIIFLTTNNNTINNNTYNDNKQTVINNEGDVYNYDYDDDDPPINPPSGGGGDDPPTDPDDWGIDLPDLNIDWLLTGKENKFPFNIPFNIILTLSLLNAEPEAPHFEGTIDLGVYQWNYEIDLEQFDPAAEVCRNFEFIAFLIGLMLLTKRLIWG